MDTKKEQKIKAQEWVVMFDGQIKKSEKEIDSNEHHLEVNIKNDGEWLDFDWIGQTRKKVNFARLLNYFLLKLIHFLMFFVLLWIH